MFKPNLAPICSFRSSLEHPKIVVSDGLLRAFDLTSEVIGCPETLKLGTIGFLLFSATRSFFREAVTPLGAERVVGPTDTPSPHTFDAM